MRPGCCLSVGTASAIVPRMLSKGFSVALLLAAAISRGDDWPQWLGPKRDAVWRETGILEKFPPEGPKVRWRVPVGAGFSGPAVADGRVYLMDRVLKTGASGQSDPF